MLHERAEREERRFKNEAAEELLRAAWEERKKCKEREECERSELTDKREISFNCDLVAKMEKQKLNGQGLENFITEANGVLEAEA